MWIDSGERLARTGADFAPPTGSDPVLLAQLTTARTRVLTQTTRGPACSTRNTPAGPGTGAVNRTGPRLPPAARRWCSCTQRDSFGGGYAPGVDHDPHALSPDDRLIDSHSPYPDSDSVQREREENSGSGASELEVRSASRQPDDHSHGATNGDAVSGETQRPPFPMLIHVVLRLVYLSRAHMDLSLPPDPDSLKPPNGAVMSA